MLIIIVYYTHKILKTHAFEGLVLIIGDTLTAQEYNFREYRG